MPKKRQINKEDYPMVKCWDNYINTHSKLPCVCDGCGIDVHKTIKDIDRQGRSFCKNCANKDKGVKKRKKIDISKYPMVKCWDNYVDMSTKLHCVCDGCGGSVMKSISCLDEQNGTCFCWNCGYKIKRVDTIKRKFGVEHHWKNMDVKNKRRKTWINNYGVDNPFKSSIIKDKIKDSLLESIGVDNPMYSEIIKDRQIAKMIDKYGVTHFSQTKEFKDILITKKDVILYKQHSTKRKNNSFNKSDSEDECYRLIIRKYAESDIIRNYNSDPRYPFCVDFYIKSLDLFIECNFHWTHGKEPFSENNPTHIKILKEWAIKAETSKFYSNAVEVWTMRDVGKIKTALDNNLNYLVFYSKHDFIKWFDDDGVDKIFKKCRGVSFPYPKYDSNELLKSWINLLNQTNITHKSRVGSKIVRHFHPSIYHCSVGGRISVYDAYHDDDLLLKVIRNRIKYIKNVNPRRVVEGFNISKVAPKITVFNPSTAKYLVNKHLNNFNEVFDPFSGYSGRMLGVSSLKKKYIGQDINETTINESKDIIDFLKITNATVVVSDVLSSNGTYESLFTCPPYNLKERWNNENQLNLSCDDWIDICLSRFDCKSYLFVVDKTEKYKNFIVEELYNKSHFSDNKELVIKIEKKGN